MAEDIDVPPLEDMTDVLSTTRAMREKDGVSHAERQFTSSHKTVQTEGKGDILNTGEDNRIRSSLSTESLSATKNSNDLKTVNCETSNKLDTFGGFEKGFLFSASSKKKTVSLPKTTETTSETRHLNKQEDNLPFVKKNEGETADSRLLMPDVQRVMEQTEGLLQNKDWVTDDLLTKIQNSKSLSKRLADPRFVQAIGEFQTNPTSAMEKYAENPEVQQFLQEFCGIMGEHFTSLATEQDVQIGQPVKELGPSQQKSVVTRSPTEGADLTVHKSSNPAQQLEADEGKMEKILADPQIRDILVDPWIQNLFQVLKNNPNDGQRLLQNADHEKKQKLKKLVDVGLLQFQL